MLDRAVPQDISNLLWGVAHIQEQHQAVQLPATTGRVHCFISPEHMLLLTERMLRVSQLV